MVCEVRVMATAEKHEQFLLHINDEEIDDILNELDQIDKQSTEQIPTSNNWNEILRQIRNGNINYIKNLITSKDIDICTKSIKWNHPFNLLCYYW